MWHIVMMVLLMLVTIMVTIADHGEDSGYKSNGGRRAGVVGGSDDDGE